MSTWPARAGQETVIFLDREVFEAPPSFAEATEGILHGAFGVAQDGGARRDRTDDLMLAKHALYQLSYGPIGGPVRPLIPIPPVGVGRPGQI